MSRIPNTNSKPPPNTNSKPPPNAVKTPPGVTNRGRRAESVKITHAAAAMLTEFFSNLMDLDVTELVQFKGAIFSGRDWVVPQAKADEYVARAYRKGGRPLANLVGRYFNTKKGTFGGMTPEQIARTVAPMRR